MSMTTRPLEKDMATTRWSVRWRRLSKNKIVGRIPGTATFIQLTRYKSNRVQPKGTWKMRVMVPSRAQYGVSKWHDELIAVPLPVTWPVDAVQTAQAYLTTAQGLKEGPLTKVPEMTFAPLDEAKITAYPRGGSSWEKEESTTK